MCSRPISIFPTAVIFIEFVCSCKTFYKEAARPLMELLRKKGNMEMSAFVTDETVVIMESLVGTSIEYND